MRLSAIAILAAIVPFCAQAQGTPVGWSTIVGKTCNIRNLTGGAVKAKFMQDETGPSVQLRAAGTELPVRLHTTEHDILCCGLRRGRLYLHLQR